MSFLHMDKIYKINPVFQNYKLFLKCKNNIHLTVYHDYYYYCKISVNICGVEVFKSNTTQFSLYLNMIVSLLINEVINIFDLLTCSEENVSGTFNLCVCRLDSSVS